MSVVGRYLRRSLVESPYIVVTVALTGAGILIPTISYYNGGKQKEAANRYSFRRSDRHTHTAAAKDARCMQVQWQLGSLKRWTFRGADGCSSWPAVRFAAARFSFGC
jgi:hypothetical protein